MLVLVFVNAFISCYNSLTVPNKVKLLFPGFDEPTGAQVPSMFLNFIGSSIDWGYHTEPEPAACLGEKDRKCYWPRGKVLTKN